MLGIVNIVTQQRRVFLVKVLLSCRVDSCCVELHMGMTRFMNNIQFNTLRFKVIILFIIT